MDLAEVDLGFVILLPSGEGARRADEGCGHLVTATQVETLRFKDSAISNTSHNEF